MSTTRRSVKKREKPAESPPTSPPGPWGDDWSVSIRVQVERRGEAILGEKSADLLAAIAATNSISAAARLLGISYAHAWHLAQDAGTAAGAPLVETATGGVRGGGTRLTERGRAALEVFQALTQQVGKTAMVQLPRLLAAAASPSRVLHLSAAVSLQSVVGRLLLDYALVRPTVAVRAIFGASNELADQIQAGGAADLFISASRDEVERLASAGLVERESRKVLAKNYLAIVANGQSRLRLRSVADLSKLKEGNIIVADPACPLGKCTVNYLEDAGVYQELRPRLVTVDNSRAVVLAVQNRPTDVGLVFASELSSSAGLRLLLPVPARQATAAYEGAVVKGSMAAEEAAALLKFLSSSQARATFRLSGFAV
jgi:molybdate transport system substrate-binding protein